MEFKDKKILVLGGAGSIGSAVSEAFEKEGAKVCKHSTSDGLYKADMRSTGEIESLMEKVNSDFGSIDVLVNSISAPAIVGKFEKKTWDNFLHHITVQLKAAVEVTHFILKDMKEKRYGRIINILTNYVDGETPSGLSDYISAKYAMLGLTKTLAKELARYNITVNAVSPSFIKNDFTKNVPEKLSEIIIHQTPCGRLATPEDVAHAVLFLASDKSGFITGENIHVSGGSHL